MGSNLVVFGPAHGGKSTLIGFLYAAGLSESDFHARVQAMRRELGPDFREEEKYRLLIDTALEERRRQDQPRHGTSWYMHTTSVRLAGGERSILLIDTPGRDAAASRRETLRGLFYGDVGILQIEVEKLLDAQRVSNEDILPLIAWLGFGYKRESLIVAIGKMDRVDFNQAKFEAARRLAEALIGRAFEGAGRRVPLAVVPVGIELTAGVGHNVLAPSPKMSWHRGPTLEQAIRQFTAEEPERHAEESTFIMCVKRGYNDLPFSKPAGIVVEGKVMAGSMSKGVEAKIVPALVHDSEWVPVLATIAEIRSVANQPRALERCELGDIITANCTNLRVGNQSVRRAEVSVRPSSVVVHNDTLCAIGSLLRFRMRQQVDFEGVNLSEDVELLWFGRTLNAKIVAIEASSEGTNVAIELRDANVGVPLDDAQKIKLDQYLLRIARGVPYRREVQTTNENTELPESHDPPEQKMHYVPVTLEAVAVPDKLTYEFRSDTPVGEIIDFFAAFSPEKTENLLTFTNLSYIKVVERVKEFEKSYQQNLSTLPQRVHIEPRLPAYG